MSKIRKGSQAYKLQSLTTLPLFAAADERECRVLPSQAKWVARRYRLSPALAKTIAANLFGGDDQCG